MHRPQGAADGSKRVLVGKVQNPEPKEPATSGTSHMTMDVTWPLGEWVSSTVNPKL